MSNPQDVPIPPTPTRSTSSTTQRAGEGETVADLVDQRTGVVGMNGEDREDGHDVFARIGAKTAEDEVTAEKKEEKEKGEEEVKAAKGDESVEEVEEVEEIKGTEEVRDPEPEPEPEVDLEAEKPADLQGIFGEEALAGSGDGEDVFAQLGDASAGSDTETDHQDDIPPTISGNAAKESLEEDGVVDDVSAAEKAQPETIGSAITPDVFASLADSGAGTDVFEQLGTDDAEFDIGGDGAIGAVGEPAKDIQADQAGGAAQSAGMDFSDLLAEFEDELEPVAATDIVDNTPAKAEDAPNGPPPPAALFDDADGSSAFDAFMQDGPADDIAIPTQSDATAQNAQTDIGDSSFASNASDWLADTTMATEDDHGGANENGMDGGNANGNEAITFEVPQGWYDEAGNWNWYTPEQRELVRQTMLEDAAPAAPAAKSGLGTPLYSPGSGLGQSENAARRTPQPQSQPDSAVTGSSYDPYAPTQPSTANSYGTSSGYSGYSSNPSPYAPSSSSQAQPSPYAPQQAPYDPYAPSSSSSQPKAYGLPAEPYAYNARSAPSTLRGPSTAESRPALPKRVASNAYDPPFLKPQKSFVARPASAAATPFPSMSSAGYTPGGSAMISPPGSQPPLPGQSSLAQSVLSPPTPAKPAPPPSGPPRRSKTPVAPSFAPPPVTEPAPPMPNPQLDAYQPSPAPTPVQDPYAPSNNSSLTSPPTQMAATMPPPSAPPPTRQPIRNASYNSFDPPLRPSSAARARPAAAAAPERSSTPPIAALAPPPQTAPSGPPRGPSRGSMRKPSPMFESRPPLPAFPSEHRPPSRGAVNRGVSPLVPAAEIPSRPSSRMAEISAPPAPPTPPAPMRPTSTSQDERAEKLDEEDPEGGAMADESAWSPVKRPVSPPRPAPYAYGPSGEAEEAETNPYAREDGSAPPPAAEPYGRQDSYDYGPNSRAGSFSRPGEQTRSPQTTAYDPSPYQPPSTYARPPSAEPARNDSYGLGLNTTGSPRAETRPIDDPYAPQSTPMSIAAQPDRSQPAPPSFSQHRQSSSYDPYAPSSTDLTSSYAPAPSSSTSAYQPPSFAPPASTYDPYAPRSQSTLLSPGDIQPRPASSSYGSDMGISPPQPSYFQAMNASQDTTYVPQQVLDQKPIAEDPLGRSTLAARNAPIAVFGFGGVLITAFPGRAESDSSMGHHRTPSYGYASGRGQLWIRTVSDLASTSALKPNDNLFPGPLILDPSTPKGAAGEKKKKEAVVAYLEARAEEIERGLPYLKSSASQAKREEEGKLVLVRVLLAMVLGDGKLSGKPEVEDALRNALGNTSGVNTGTGMSFASPTASMNSLPGLSARADHTRLKDLSDLLSRGDKREAVQYAARFGLWAHALVISSSVDVELWADMVSRFAEVELQAKPDLAALTASYAVFSGKTATSVDDLVSAASLSAENSNDQWREVIGSVVFNGKPADLACLDELGTRFKAAGLVYPAHACHLLAPSSPFADVSPGAYERTVSLLQNSRDEDAIVFAEIAEYARGLVVLPKGQELPFAGLPQLLPYKLHRAWLAAELGDVDQAKRYCTAVETASKPGKNQPPILSPALAASLEDLSERLTGTPSANPARLIGGRKTKAGLGSWIEGRLTKFIAGEEDTSTPAKPIPAAAKDPSAPVGPFSHFSTISPAASGGPSRNVSTGDFAGNDVSSSSSSTYEGESGTRPGAPSTFSPWYGAGGQEQPETTEDDDTPTGHDDDAEFINPMAAMSIGARGAGPSDYQPAAANTYNRQEEEEDDEDMGFGNTSLSRGRTPRPAAPEQTSSKAKDDKPAPAEEPKNDAADKPKAKGWLGGWFSKKEGEGSGPIRAKLGEESSMVFDKELKRWVVKGTKPEPLPAGPPPPPRAQTASPSQAARPDTSTTARASSATPPPATLVRNGPPPPGMPRSTTAPMGFTETPEGGIKRMKSSLADSITADEISSGTSAPPSAPTPGAGPSPGSSGPPKPPSRPGTASIDDLLSRPPSKRPGSAAKKPMRNRYVDVLTPGGGQ